MDIHESNFDLYIHDLLKDSGIDAEYQHTSISELQEAERNYLQPPDTINGGLSYVCWYALFQAVPLTHLEVPEKN